MKRVIVLAALVCSALGCGPVSTTDAGSPDSDPADAGFDAGPPPDTWESSASAFFSTYCVGCHASGTRDYRTIEHVVRDQERIRCGIRPAGDPLDGCGAFSPAAEQFPVGDGPFPTADERTRTIQWIDDGLLTDADL